MLLIRKFRVGIDFQTDSWPYMLTLMNKDSGWNSYRWAAASSSRPNTLGRIHRCFTWCFLHKFYHGPLGLFKLSLEVASQSMTGLFSSKICFSSVVTRKAEEFSH